MTTQNIPAGPPVDTQFLRSYTFPVTANKIKIYIYIIIEYSYVSIDFSQIHFKSFYQTFVG